MASSRDARRAVHGEADVATALERGLARAEAHANADLSVLRPRVFRERALRVDRSIDSGLRAREDVEERVALGVELVASLGRERRSHDRLVLRESLAVALAELTLEPASSPRCR